MLGAAGDLLVANAVKDGFFEDKKVEGMGLHLKGSNGFEKNSPMTFTYWVTDAGVEFIRRFPSVVTLRKVMANHSPEPTRVGRPPLAAQLQR